MAAEHLYFYEDEVFRINKKGNLELGMVLENSEHVSSDEEDEDYEGGVRNGYIRVGWHPSGAEEVLPEKKVNLADRSLMPGDVVRRLIKGKDTQRGYCRSIRVKSDLLVVGSKQVIRNVGSQDLTAVEQFMPGVVVALRSWVGTIKSVSSRLHLMLPDGSRCTISDVEAEEFVDIGERRGEADFPHRNDFHPGQTLVGCAQDLQNAHWVTVPKDLKSRPNKVLRLMVEDIETCSVTVHWQCCAYSGKQEQPETVVDGDDLKLLKPINVFESCTLQIGDRSFYILKDSDTIVSKDVWYSQQEWALADRKTNVKRKVSESQTKIKPEDNKELPEVDGELKPGNEGWETDEGDSASVSSGCSSSNSSAGGGQARKKKNTGLMTKMLKYKKLRRTRRKSPSITLKPNSRVVVEALMTSSCADVVWQDGSVEVGIPSTQLYPIHHLDDQEFFPGDFVVENRDKGCLRMYGVVQSVDHVGRLARVTWFHTYLSSQKESEPKRLETVQVSVYDLKDHPDFQYRPGTVALLVANFDRNSDGAVVGQVLDNYPEGRVHMWWVDGKTSMCWPQDLYKVGDYDSDEGELWEDNGSEGSWETESEEELVEDIKPRLAMNIEKARVAMSRLEDHFTHNPGLQTVSIMQKLLEVYRDCRYLDKLMGTSYFHERHFQGLLERVRERNRSTSLAGQRISDQVSRLSSPLQCNNDSTSNCTDAPCRPEMSLERVNQTLESLNVCLEQNLTKAGSEEAISPKSPNSINGGEKSPISLNGEKSPNSMNGGTLVQSTSQDDSGVFEHSAVSADASSSENCDCLETTAVESRKGTYVFGAHGSRGSYGLGEKRGPRLSKQFSTNVLPGLQATDVIDDTNPCAKLCALIKAQLCLAFSEVFERFHSDGSRPRLSDVEKCPDEEEVKGDEEAPPTPGVEEVSSLVPATVSDNGEGFEVMPSAPASHTFRLGFTTPDSMFLKTVRKELALLRNALPPGIWVKGYEDRMDLYSIMIRGPTKTPYEDGLFLFDAQMPRDYPAAPPIFNYHSYCSDRLNPNLYEDGKVCVSLLGTWKGRGTEVWTSNSTMLQVIVSIQGLILVKEPYYNEAGYEKQKGSQQGHENSRMYNEMAILKLVQAMTKLAQYPHPEFHKEIKLHFAQNSERLINRVEKWLNISEKYNEDVPQSPGVTCPETDARARNEQWLQSEIYTSSTADQPEFPLLPASRGFCITMRKTLEGFRSIVGQNS